MMIAPRSHDGLWMMTSDRTLVQQITHTVNNGSGIRMPVAGVCTDLNELGASLSRQPTSAAIVDIDPAPDVRLMQLEPLITRFSQTRFIVVSDRVESQLMMAAMSAGVRQFVPKPAIDDELPRALRRLVNAGLSGGGDAGSVITITSAGGGCGATTLAVNLLCELLASGDQQKTGLVMDLDFAYGSVGVLLGLKGDYGICEVLDSGRIDPQLVSSSATQYNEQVHVLLSPASMPGSATPPLGFDQLEPMIDAARQCYAWVVIDAARLPAEPLGTLGRVSDRTLIVTQLTVPHLRGARRIRTTLLDHGTNEPNVHLLINRYNARHRQLDWREARRAWGDDAPIALIRNEYGDAVRASTLGKPLRECAHRSRLRRDIAALASELIASRTQSATTYARSAT